MMNERKAGTHQLRPSAFRVPHSASRIRWPIVVITLTSRPPTCDTSSLVFPERPLAREGEEVAGHLLGERQQGLAVHAGVAEVGRALVVAGLGEHRADLGQLVTEPGRRRLAA